MALSLLAEGLRGLGRVMVVLAKVFSAAMEEAFMKMDIWGRNEEKNARNKVISNIVANKYTDEQMDSFGIPKDLQHFKGGSISEARSQLKKMQKYFDSLDLDALAGIATANKDADMSTAIEDFIKGNKAAMNRIGSVGENIVKDINKKSGMDVDEIYKENRNEAQSMYVNNQRLAAPFVGPPKPPPAQPEKPYVNPDLAYNDVSVDLKMGQRLRNVDGNVITQPYVEKINTMVDEMEKFIEVTGSAVDAATSKIAQQTQKMADIESRTKQL